jgi:hypothetical protein
MDASAPCCPFHCGELIFEIALESLSRRPINVLLPSSTLPQVMKRRSSFWENSIRSIVNSSTIV